MKYELTSYQMLAAVKYPDTVAFCLELYSETVALIAAAECAYIREHRALPKWGWYITGFEIEGDDFIFVHRETGQEKVN